MILDLWDVKPYLKHIWVDFVPRCVSFSAVVRSCDAPSFPSERPGQRSCVKGSDSSSYQPPEPTESCRLWSCDIYCPLLYLPLCLTPCVATIPFIYVMVYVKGRDFKITTLYCFVSLFSLLYMESFFCLVKIDGNHLANVPYNNLWFHLSFDSLFSSEDSESWRDVCLHVCKDKEI